MSRDYMVATARTPMDQYCQARGPCGYRFQPRLSDRAGSSMPRRRGCRCARSVARLVADGLRASAHGVLFEHNLGRVTSTGLGSVVSW